MSSLRRRAERLISEACARREAAWQPILRTLQGIVCGETARAMDVRARRWTPLSMEERERAVRQLPVWGSKEQDAAWTRWFAGVGQAVTTGGAGEDFPGVWPEQFPAPPEEPPGLWDALQRLALDPCEAGPLRGAASEALLWLAIARALRSYRSGFRN